MALAKTGLYQVWFTWNQNEKGACKVRAEASEFCNVNAYQLDLNSEGIEKIETLVESVGGFDVVVHNAGFCNDVPFFLMEKNQWDSVISAGLNSFYYINKAVLPMMIEKRWGRIITLASISGESGNRGQTNYAAVKGALIAATKSLAKEMGKKNILCNVVSPGIIETDMTEHLKVDLRSAIPQGRYGKPEEVASVIAFLASDQASYINGETIRINGGLYT